MLLLINMKLSLTNWYFSVPLGKLDLIFLLYQLLPLVQLRLSLLHVRTELHVLFHIDFFSRSFYFSCTKLEITFLFRYFLFWGDWKFTCFQCYHHYLTVYQNCGYYQYRILLNAWKVSVFGVIVVCIFPQSDSVQTDTPYLSVLSPNAGKYGPE